MRNYSVDVKGKALEVSVMLTDANELLTKTDINNKVTFTSDGQLRRALECGVNTGLFHRIGSSAATRFVSAKKYSKRLENKHNSDVKKAAKERLNAKRDKETKERQRIAKEVNTEKARAKKQDAKKERARIARIAKRYAEKAQKEMKEKAEARAIRQQLAEEMKVAEEEAYKEQSIRLEVESMPPKVKAKFIGHDTEQRTSHRRIGTFFWFKAEQNGGECIGARA